MEFNLILTLVKLPIDDSSFSIHKLQNQNDNLENQEQYQHSYSSIYSPKEFQLNQEFMSCLKQYLQVGINLNKIKK
ncbi:unnamed protein product [Paramecium sonneborni]|uniref:Uncharacterized protein n=1 Tax=Paramecium sonneborni TaxID=65129 RepID=A0A8S1RGU2_9CILI|nr:unnamed protein product [Paramecium sonneborni]